MTMAARHEFVYLILSHGKGSQLYRLIRTLKSGSPNAAVVVHHDAKGDLPDFKATDIDSGIYVVTPRIAVTWGEFSLLEAILHSLRFISTQLDYDWVSMISENDYPATALHKIETELRETTFDAFIRSTPVTWNDYAARYYLQYFIVPRNPYAYRIPKFIRNLAYGLRRSINARQNYVHIEGGVRGVSTQMGVRYRAHPFDTSFVCHKGSTWFTMSRQAVHYLLDFETVKPEILRWYRRTWVPDESYFQTVLKNTQSLNVSNDHRRFIKWDTAHLAHPKTLTISDLSEILGSGMHFARKVDANIDCALLDELDRVILE